MPTVPLEELRVYCAAEQITDAIWQAVVEWNQFAKDTVGKQVVRAADSIGANIAEGYGRGSFVDNRRFVKIARGSLYETRYFLRRAERRQLVSSDDAAHLHAMLQSLAPSLNAYLRSIGSGVADEDDR
jgi:four helix bundle protein